MKAFNKSQRTGKGFKAIRQRIFEIERNLNNEKNKLSSISISLSSDDLTTLGKTNTEKYSIQKNKNNDSISLSSDCDDLISSTKKSKMHYSSKTLSFFSKSFSSSDDSIETNSKNMKKNEHNVHYHYRYKNRCEDFSVDTATSDFDDLFSYSSLSSSLDLSDDDL